jgi:pyrimidine oxygenase
MTAHEYGIFLPIGNGGWIVSESAPHPDGTYEYNRKAAMIGERVGLDFIMSMAKWRGHGGTTDHWGATLESMTMMAGLAEATERVKIWATVHTVLFHPAIAAKMFATLNEISGGRVGMNIVVGSYAQEFGQMGLWPSHLSHDDRYRYTEEWTTVLKRLWTEDSVTADGEFFHLEDCRSRPHPSPMPTLICAGRSPRGIEFMARHCDAAFTSGADYADLRLMGTQLRERAADYGNTIKTYTMMTVVIDDTDTLAEQRYQRYAAKPDITALENMTAGYDVTPQVRTSMTSKAVKQGGFITDVVTGSPATLVDKIGTMLDQAGTDGLMLIFPDYHNDLTAFGELVLPALRGDAVAPGAGAAASDGAGAGASGAGAAVPSAQS